MNLFALNLVLALIWTAITGSFSLLNLLFGFILSAAMIYLIRSQTHSTNYFRKAWLILSLTILFFKELTLSVWKVAVTVMTPSLDLKPGIIAYELKAKTNFEITLLANLITLTPGTFSVDVSEDRKFLYIHALDCSDPQAIKDDIANGFEHKILEAFR